MSVKTEGRHPAEFIKSSFDDISYDEGVLSSGQNVQDGQVVKVVGGELVAATGSADSDGDSNEVIAGIVIGDHNVSADTKVPYLKCLATVKESAVKLHTTVGGGAAAATAVILAELAKKFIFVREG